MGIYYAGIKTTSIFCISTCRAKKPKKQNVVFFTTIKEALTYGYRPCKLCRPHESSFELPEQVKQVLKLIKEYPKVKIKDSDLRRKNIQPEFVRRWFNKNYGITFQGYQRMNRINNAFKEMKNGKSITEVAFESGYESLSGFGYTFKKLVGSSPQKSNNIILLNRLTTPIGPMFIGATDEGVCLLEFTDRKMLETELKDLQRLIKAEILLGENSHIVQAKKEIEAYFNGKLKQFTVAIHSPGTDFQVRAWNLLKEIPYGKTTTYMEQAKKTGNTNSVRAIGTANGSNRIAIIIPCHRVIGKNGKLVGYGGGIERKKWLLNFEHENCDSKMSLF